MLVYFLIPKSCMYLSEGINSFYIIKTKRSHVWNDNWMHLLQHL